MAATKKKAAASEATTKTKTAKTGGKDATAGASRVAKPIREVKPGWTARVFGIETGSLMACDASWDGTTWVRGEKFRFLFRSRRAKYFLLQDVHKWSILTEDDAKKLYAELPEKLMDEAQAFQAGEYEQLPQNRDEDEDTRAYKVVRNDTWDFSIWLDYKEMAPGWKHIGITGTKRECLEYIAKNCVFGAPNPGMS